VLPVWDGEAETVSVLDSERDREPESVNDGETVTDLLGEIDREAVEERDFDRVKEGD
jgi:hypothetical protein